MSRQRADFGMQTSPDRTAHLLLITEFKLSTLQVAHHWPASLARRSCLGLHISGELFLVGLHLPLRLVFNSLRKGITSTQ